MTNPSMPFPGQQPPPYPGASEPAPAARPRKPWFKRWWAWVLIVIVLIGLGNILGRGASNQAAPPAVEVTQSTGGTQTEPTSSDPLTLDKGWKIDKSNQFAVFVTGYVTNNTDQAITNYVQITFDTLDSDGANLGTCLDNTNTIDAKGKWKFKAICTGEAKEIKKVRFKEISGF